MNNSKNFNKRSNSNCKNTSQNNGIGLEDLSYADFVLLSSILAYAIAEELNNTDLDLFIVFLGIVQSDLATLRLQRGIKNNSAIVESETTGKIAEEAIIPSTRYSKIKKVKKIKRKKRN